MAAKPRVQSPDLIAKAQEWGVDLTSVQATADSGVISRDDVFRKAITQRLHLPQNATNAEVLAVSAYIAAENKARQARAAEQTAQAAEQAAALEKASAERAQLTSASASLSGLVAGRGPAFALNPLVAKVRAEATAAGEPQPTGGAPTLFASGDLPSFCASGLSPETLLQVPWEARHAMAAAPTQAEAYAILQACTGGDQGASAEDIAFYDYSDHPGNADYAQRVRQWQLDAVTDDQIEAMFVSHPMGAKVAEYEREHGLDRHVP